jgi:hypothetical protein
MFTIKFHGNWLAKGTIEVGFEMCNRLEPIVRLNLESDKDVSQMAWDIASLILPNGPAGPVYQFKVVIAANG